MFLLQKIIASETYKNDQYGLQSLVEVIFEKHRMAEMKQLCTKAKVVLKLKTEL